MFRTVVLILVTPWIANAKPGCSDSTALERRLQRAGLVNVQKLDHSLRVDLRYASPHNFFKKNLYGPLCHCYLHPEIAAMLVEAQKQLKQQFPRLTILVLDCARPGSAQQKMWQAVKGSENQKYVANPTYGSLHSYGAAVDVTLADTLGHELDMGTPYDSFSRLAQPWQEQFFFKKGMLTQDHLKNRQLLRDVMKRAGFLPLRMEWWHFNGLPNKEIRRRFKILK